MLSLYSNTAMRLSQHLMTVLSLLALLSNAATAQHPVGSRHSSFNRAVTSSSAHRDNTVRDVEIDPSTDSVFMERLNHIEKSKKIDESAHEAGLGHYQSAIQIATQLKREVDDLLVYGLNIAWSHKKLPQPLRDALKTGNADLIADKSTPLLNDPTSKANIMYSVLEMHKTTKELIALCKRKSQH